MINPNEYDIVTSDIPPDALHTKVSDFLGCKYFSITSEPILKEVQGRIYGGNKRCLCTLPVSIPLCKPPTRNIHFLVDTGSRVSYLATSALDAYGLPPWSLSEAPFLVNGTKLILHWSDEVGHIQGLRFDSHFKGVNVLGMDFMTASEASFSVHAHGKRAYCEFLFPTCWSRCTLCKLTELACWRGSNGCKLWCLLGGRSQGLVAWQCSYVFSHSHKAADCMLMCLARQMTRSSSTIYGQADAHAVTRTVC